MFLLIGVSLMPFLGWRILGYPISDWFFALSFLLVLLKTPDKKTRISSLIPNRIFVGFTFIGTGSLLSSVISKYPFESIFTTLKLIFFGVGLLYLFVYHAVEGRNLKRIVYGFLLGSLVFSISIFINFSQIRSTYSNRFIRAVGFSDHITNAAGVLLVAVVFSFALIQERRYLIFHICLAATFGLALIYTGSVSAFLTLVIALLAPNRLTALGSIKKRLLFIAIASTTAVVVQTQGLYDIFGRFVNATSGRYNTFATREANIFAGIDELFSSVSIFVLGNGVGRQDGYVTDSLGGVSQVHNTLLQAWFQGGVFSFLGFILIWVVPFFSRPNHIRSGEWRILCLPALASLMFSMSSPLMLQRYIWIPILLLTTSTILDRYERAQSLFLGKSLETSR